MAPRLSAAVERVLYSHRIGAYRFPGSRTIPFGHAHHSHALVCRRILGSLAHLGIEAHELVRPEMYAAPVAFQSIDGFRRGDIHLIFKPIEEIRILRGAYNIACVLWEFDQLNSHARSDDPFTHHVRMLKMVDEVWCYCTFTRAVVQKYFANVHFIPVPFAAPGRTNNLSLESRITSDLSSIPTLHVASRRFGKLEGFLKAIPSMNFVALSVFNPGDPRKNIANILRAFTLFQLNKPGAVLVLKLIVDNDNHPLETALSLIEQHCAAEDCAKTILVITEEMPTDRLASLYRLADFYICASRCEGVGMPLLEAMGYGAIPIAVDNTAMADYINEQNAFVISSKSELAPPDSNSSLNPDLHWYDAGVTSISLALENAYHSSPEVCDNKRRAAIQTVQTHYSVETCASHLNARLRAVRPASAAPIYDAAK
ncbi:MAG TPA: glycosyltransferase [Xanthobacteraceae bacterium]|nr:glycosyltransferase [Xanthobacteraceae bacterium]